MNRPYTEEEKKIRWAKVVDLPTLRKFADDMMMDKEPDKPDNFGDACDRLWLDSALLKHGGLRQTK